MATNPILKKFVIQDDEACDRLIAALNEPSEPIKTMNYYEEGIRFLEEFFGEDKQ